MKLYTHPLSPAAQKVRLTLAEKHLDCSRHHVDLPNKENLEPWYLRLNPRGTLPTLVDGDTVVNESSVICEFLEDQYPKTSLRPADNAQRAAMRSWMNVVDDRLHYACGALIWPALMRPALLDKTAAEREAILSRIPDRARQARHRRWVEHGVDNPDFRRAVLVYQDTAEMMNSSLAEREWLAGDQFSLADCALLPYFHAMAQMGWDGIYSTCGNVSDWFERGRARPSFRNEISEQVSSDMLAAMNAAGTKFRDRVLEVIATDHRKLALKGNAA
ncbi:MAG: glutathione S-transferase family protein [Woeseia sp.]|jgi:glutathione S-transferase|nr:glutathione S-transferase family protein [Woeseia sp.]